jgi:D-xylonolactonase
MQIEPKIVADYPCNTGENPLWHPQEKRVYWADIPAGRLYRYDPATHHSELCYEGNVIGGFTLQQDGALLLFMGKCAVGIWHDGQLTTIIEGLPGEENNRFNDVIADPRGRVFCGTMSPPDRLGRLYRLDPDGTIRVILEGVGTSNGMGFTSDLKHFYHTDSRTRKVTRYDYDIDTGEISNPRLFLELPEGQGTPDGMTIDSEGYIWTAVWDGSVLVRRAPDGTIERQIPFPCKRVSSVIFGGDDYTDLYMTTAGGQDRATYGPGAGSLFHLNLGIKGVPEFTSRIRL